MELCCPITRSLCRDPVRTCCGSTYDREAIETYWQSGPRRDPLTNLTLPDATLRPNHEMRRSIQAFLDANPSFCPSAWPSRTLAPVQQHDPVRQPEGPRAEDRCDRCIERFMDALRDLTDRCGPCVRTTAFVFFLVFCFPCIFGVVVKLAWRENGRCGRAVLCLLVLMAVGMVIGAPMTLIFCGGNFASEASHHCSAATSPKICRHQDCTWYSDRCGARCVPDNEIPRSPVNCSEIVA